LVVAGVGTGIVNAALGRIAIESVPPARVGMGSGANNTARYLGGAAGVALVVTVASAAGPSGPTVGWNHAALLSTALCGLGAVIVASCTAWRPAAVHVPASVRHVYHQAHRERPADVTTASGPRSHLSGRHPFRRSQPNSTRSGHYGEPVTSERSVAPATERSCVEGVAR
jgi:MFS family permease